MSASILWWLAQNTVAAAVLVGFVALVCRLLSTKPALQHALWVIVLLKLVTPPVITWPWSARDVIGWMRSGDRMTTVASGASPAAVAREAAANHLVGPDEMSSNIESGQGDRAVRVVASRLVRIGLSSKVLTGLVVAVWMTGTGLALAVQVRRLAWHHRLVRLARPASACLAEEVRQVARLMVVRPVPARIAAVASPFIWCLGWLQLIWPENLSEDVVVRRCRGVIAHELAHVKRGDHWVVWLELVAGCIWWWNPLFWYARRQLRETADLACDALALNVVPGADRRAYAETFLELSQPRRQKQAPLPALGISSGARRTIERRLSMMLNERVQARRSPVGLLVAGLVAVVALPAWSLGQTADADLAVAGAGSTDGPREAITRPADDISAPAGGVADMRSAASDDTFARPLAAKGEWLRWDSNPIDRLLFGQRSKLAEDLPAKDIKALWFAADSKTREALVELITHPEGLRTRLRELGQSVVDAHGGVNTEAIDEMDAILTAIREFRARLLQQFQQDNPNQPAADVVRCLEFSPDGKRLDNPPDPEAGSEAQQPPKADRDMTCARCHRPNAADVRQPLRDAERRLIEDWLRSKTPTGDERGDSEETLPSESEPVRDSEPEAQPGTDKDHKLRQQAKEPEDSPPLTEFRVFALRHAESEVVARTLRQVFQQGDVKGLEIEEDEQLNRILVHGRPEELEVIEVIIAHFDQNKRPSNHREPDRRRSEQPADTSGEHNSGTPRG